MATISRRLEQAGLELPEPPQPLATYVPAVAVHTGTPVLVSGQLPLRDGKLLATGRVPSEVSPEDATRCARQCVLNALAALYATVGSLDRVRGVARVGGFVACDPGFPDQPKIINGASELLVEVLGDAGKHARAAVGVAALPLNAPVEIEFTFVID